MQSKDLTLATLHQHEYLALKILTISQIQVAEDIQELCMVMQEAHL